MSDETYTLERYMAGRGIYEPPVVLKEDGEYWRELIGNGEYWVEPTENGE